MKKLAILLASTAILGGTASAGEFKFKYDRELLESQSGAEKVYSRLTDRVKSYCQAGSVRSLADKNAESACIANMLSQAISDIGDRRLTRLHNEYTRVAAR